MDLKEAKKKEQSMQKEIEKLENLLQEGWFV
jgi:hypothetical protein